jgi:predicted enzyme related to lactoylglutathione lyase
VWCAGGEAALKIKLGGVAAVVVFSDNPSRLAAWYREVFDVREVVNQGDFIGLYAGKLTLFIQRTSEGHRPGVGGVRPHFVVAACHAASDRLRQAGASELLPVTDTGGELVAAFQDPEGNPIGLLQPK